MTFTDRLIDETLRLDGEATRGPWRFVRPGRVESSTTGLSLAFCGPSGIYKNGFSVHTTEDQCEWNAMGIAFYRTSAPRLARMLRVAIECLVSEEDNPHIGNAKALAEIEKIAKEEA